MGQDNDNRHTITSIVGLIHRSSQAGREAIRDYNLSSRVPWDSLDLGDGLPKLIGMLANSPRAREAVLASIPAEELAHAIDPEDETMGGALDALDIDFVLAWVEEQVSALSMAEAYGVETMVQEIAGGYGVVEVVDAVVKAYGVEVVLAHMHSDEFLEEIGPDRIREWMVANTQHSDEFLDEIGADRIREWMVENTEVSEILVWFSPGDKVEAIMGDEDLFKDVMAQVWESYQSGLELPSAENLAEKIRLMAACSEKDAALLVKQARALAEVRNEVRATRERLAANYDDEAEGSKNRLPLLEEGLNRVQDVLTNYQVAEVPALYPTVKEG